MKLAPKPRERPIITSALRSLLHEFDRSGGTPPSFDLPFNIALTGIRRSYFFIGIGVSAGRNPDFRQFHLEAEQSDPSSPAKSFRLGAPETIEEENSIKAEFSQWIIGCGLAEFLHLYGLFLEHLYAYMLFCQHIIGRCSRKASLARENRFLASSSIHMKSQLLHDEFEIPNPLYGYIDGYIKARNCLVHNAGYVNHSNVTDADSLVIRWECSELFIASSRNNEILKLPHVVEEESVLKHRLAPTERSFKIGEKVILTPTDVFEILVFCMTQIERINHSVSRSLERMGMTIVREGTKWSAMWSGDYQHNK